MFRLGRFLKRKQRVTIKAHARQGSAAKVLYHLERILEFQRQRRNTLRSKSPYRKGAAGDYTAAIERRRTVLLGLGYDVPDDMDAVATAIEEMKP